MKMHFRDFDIAIRFRSIFKDLLERKRKIVEAIVIVFLRLLSDNVIHKSDLGEHGRRNNLITDPNKSYFRDIYY